MMSFKEMADLFGYYMPWSEDIYFLAVDGVTGQVSSDKKPPVRHQASGLTLVNAAGDRIALFEITIISDADDNNQYRVIYNGDHCTGETFDCFTTAYLTAITSIAGKIGKQIIATSVAAYFEKLLDSLHTLAKKIEAGPCFVYSGIPFRVLYDFSSGAKLLMPFFAQNRSGSEIAPRIVGPANNSYVVSVIKGPDGAIRDKWLIVNQPAPNKPTPVDMTCDGIFGKMIECAFAHESFTGHAALSIIDKMNAIGDSLKDKADFKSLYGTKEYPV